MAVDRKRAPARPPVGIDDRGDLAVGVDGAEGRVMLFALAGVDGTTV
jgi:hypothetical protein